MICELCQVNSGRINALLHCCMVRGLAQSPEHVRKAHYDTLKTDELQLLREEVKAERQRLREMKQVKSSAARNKAMEIIKGIK